MKIEQKIWDQQVLVTKEVGDRPVKSAKGLFYAIALVASRLLNVKVKHCVCPIHKEHFCAMAENRRFAYWYAKGADSVAVQKYNDGETIPLAIEVRI